MMPMAGEIIGGWVCFDVIVAGTCAMFHLLKEDQQCFGYFGIVVLYVLVYVSYITLK